MRRSSSQSWVSLGLDTWLLGVEASTVIGLRTMKMAMGGADAGAEARLMVDEKIRATADMQIALATGQLGGDPVTAGRSVVRHFTRKVRANRRRLSKIAR